MEVVGERVWWRLFRGKLRQIGAIGIEEYYGFTTIEAAKIKSVKVMAWKVGNSDFQVCVLF